ncbi:MAG: hypothetical protein BGO51_28405 [Rhodospirillales bacterium 69-11]|nr:hypothetical protein [Rhodospirillales bacterium]OJW25226.1 MAG: hypothetical protein BGO51_28405 [Rhodospirillales bacterium 69-11]
MSSITVESLRPDQIHAVYPLIREAVPNLAVADWVRFARTLTGSRRAGQTGIVAARRQGRSYPCGLFCYRVDQDLQRGKVLIAEHFVAVDLLDPAAVLAALVAELDALGERLGCTAIRSVVHGAEPGLSGGLAAAGHAPEGMLLLKPLLNAARPRRMEAKPRETTPRTATSASCGRVDHGAG